MLTTKFIIGKLIAAMLLAASLSGKTDVVLPEYMTPEFLLEQATASAPADMTDTVIDGITIDSIDRWDEIKDYTYDRYYSFLKTLLDSGDFAPHYASDGYSGVFNDMIKNVEFGDYTITAISSEYGDYEIILKVEVIESDADFFPVGANIYRISEGLPDVVITHADSDKGVRKDNFSDTPAQKALNQWFSTCYGYQFPEFGELPDDDMYRRYLDYSTAEKCYMSDIGEYIILTSGKGMLTYQDMNDSAQKYFGVEFIFPKGMGPVIEENGIYYVGGHGGELWGLSVIGEVQENDEVTVTVQFYADFSKLVKSHLIDYKFKILDDGTLAFHGSEIIEKAQLEPAHVSV